MLEDIGNSTSLYVGNLHPNCSEATLFDKFSPVGPIISIRVCRDIQTGFSLGYAYVNYMKHEDAKKALDNFNYDQLDGQPLRIMWAQKDLKSKLSAAANLVVKNLPKSIDDKILKDIFSSCGTVLSVKVVTYQNGDSKGYGFVQFESEKSANEAISKLHGTIIHGRNILVSKFIPSELEELCLCFGNIRSAKVVTNEDNKSKGYGFVCFQSPEEASRAVTELNRLLSNAILNGLQSIMGMSVHDSSL
ncbi:polyadenylate-binding protein 1-like 2 [Argiope bruennichi]|uniref:polyadenylate-binding protein 1-like 2 n=1 Tax=Argiope bruennichi TaxID=94029 RepID=UPI0024952DAF|nr:polyadenylate-binding protein 1-like 2 [Argiope bruennichi]